MQISRAGSAQGTSLGHSLGLGRGAALQLQEQSLLQHNAVPREHVDVGLDSVPGNRRASFTDQNTGKQNFYVLWLS